MFSVRLSTIILRGFLVALLCSTAALASDLKVTVQSPSGGRVSGVQVSLFRVTDNAGVGVQATAGDGTATFPHLANGQYRLVVLAPGFAEQSQQVSIPKAETLSVRTEACDHTADRGRLRHRNSRNGGTNGHFGWSADR